MINRIELDILKSRITSKRQFIQVLSGPRQVGKTTIINQLNSDPLFEVIQINGDMPGIKDRAWLLGHWEAARRKSKNNFEKKIVVLAIDEIQKIEEWPEIIKHEWDNDTQNQIDLKIILLGSSKLLIQDGLSESLAGRFEIIPVTHWKYYELKAAFNYSVEDYLYYGSYPGANVLIGDEERWKSYILQSIVETTISKDILQMKKIEKPILLKKAFYFSCNYSAQILSFQKILGQINDKGNATTIAHYLDLLDSAGLIKPLQKFSPNLIRQRQSSPKLLVYNTAFMSALFEDSKKDLFDNSELLGRWYESMIGAELLNRSLSEKFELFYWNSGDYEVDFVIKKGSKILAIEVKSGNAKGKKSGLNLFLKEFPKAKVLLIGGKDGIGYLDFLSSPTSDFLGN